MNVDNVIKEVATLLQLTDVVNADLSNFESLGVQTQKDVNLILSSMNEVLSNVATEHLPLKANETIIVTQNAFDLNELSKQFFKLIRVKTQKAYNVDFETLKIENGTYEVEYLYLPEEYQLGDDITEFSKALTVYSLAYGVAGEYCLVGGNYSEAELWNSKFLNAISKFSKPHKTFSLKSRRWL